ncbi:hypothetical protein B484DRAFT_200837 [Ochromonadaceae sp. CCMP2298]|nr:hypothetical protein B484DRAFT_200837 [Ochromonadaceae sp. CCMP2298]
MKASRSKALENSVVDQVNGGVSRLRHLLRQQDASHSGSVNKNEFATALRKAGVALDGDQVSELYATCAQEVASDSLPGYSHGRALNIDNFANRVQSRTAAPALSHTHSKGFGDGREAEAVRVMRKVLHSASKLTNPHAVYDHIDSRHSGHLSAPQLQEALGHMGAVLSTTEFDVLLKEVERGGSTNGDGSVEIARFERQLRDEVGSFDRQRSESNSARLLSKSYHSSYRTSVDLQLATYTEFEPLCHEQGAEAQEQPTRKWNALREMFQRHPHLIKHAFSGTSGSSAEDQGADRSAGGSCGITQNTLSVFLS